jgi:hypothetical protein
MARDDVEVPKVLLKCAEAVEAHGTLSVIHSLFCFARHGFLSYFGPSGVCYTRSRCYGDISVIRDHVQSAAAKS